MRLVKAAGTARTTTAPLRSPTLDEAEEWERLPRWRKAEPVRWLGLSEEEPSGRWGPLGLVAGCWGGATKTAEGPSWQRGR